MKGPQLSSSASGKKDALDEFYTLSLTLSYKNDVREKYTMGGASASLRDLSFKLFEILETIHYSIVDSQPPKSPRRDGGEVVVDSPDSSVDSEDSYSYLKSRYNYLNCSQQQHPEEISSEDSYSAGSTPECSDNEGEEGEAELPLKNNNAVQYVLEKKARPLSNDCPLPKVLVQQQQGGDTTSTTATKKNAEVFGKDEVERIIDMIEKEIKVSDTYSSSSPSTTTSSCSSIRIAGADSDCDGDDTATGKTPGRHRFQLSTLPCEVQVFDINFIDHVLITVDHVIQSTLKFNGRFNEGSIRVITINEDSPSGIFMEPIKWLVNNKFFCNALGVEPELKSDILRSSWNVQDQHRFSNNGSSALHSCLQFHANAT